MPNNIRRRLDSQDMYQKMIDFPNQLNEGVRIARAVDLSDLGKSGFDKIIMAGMGGSAIGGDLVRSLLARQLKIPFVVHRNYGLPAFVSPDSMVICSSYSGNTEETLSSFEMAKIKGCRTISITTNGQLAKMTSENRSPLATLPKGFPPRAALGYSFSAMLILLGRLRICRDYSVELSEEAEFLSEESIKYRFESVANPALELAQKISGKIPIIYSGPDLLETVGLRIKGQICENAKQLAFSNIFPEFNHNELVGWESAKAFGDRLIVIILKDQDDHPQVKKRMAIFGEIMESKGVGVEEILGIGKSSLQRMLALIQLGDFLSYYLALLNEVDPTPIEVIDLLKEKLG